MRRARNARYFADFRAVFHMRILEERAGLRREILQNSIELVLLSGQCGDREIAAVIGEHRGDAFARLDHALDEHDLTRGNAHLACDEAAQKHFHRRRGCAHRRASPTTRILGGVRLFACEIVG